MSETNNITSAINKIATYEIEQTKKIQNEKEKIQQPATITTKVSDSIELSDTARLMSVAKQEIDMIEQQEANGVFQEDRNAKIELLKQQIADGTYKINTLDIAKKLIIEESNTNA